MPTCRTDGTTNRPSSFVMASNVAAVFTFVTLTAAPATLAPLGSVTRPVMDARSFCANADEHNTRQHSTPQGKERRVDLIITNSSFLTDSQFSKRPLTRHPRISVGVKAPVHTRTLNARENIPLETGRTEND